MSFVLYACSMGTFPVLKYAQLLHASQSLILQLTPADYVSSHPLNAVLERL